MGAASGQEKTTWLSSATKGMHLGPKGTGDAPGAVTMQLAGVAHVHTNAVGWRLKHSTIRVEVELWYSETWRHREHVTLQCPPERYGHYLIHESTQAADLDTYQSKLLCPLVTQRHAPAMKPSQTLLAKPLRTRLHKRGNYLAGGIASESDVEGYGQ